jgi:hypothetical protein
MRNAVNWMIQKRLKLLFYTVFNAACQLGMDARAHLAGEGWWGG